VNVIRSIWVWANLLVSTPLLSAPAALLGIFRIRSPYYEWSLRTWSKWVLRVAGVRLRVEGIEHAAVGQPRIYVSNHQSWFDVFALAAGLPGHYRFVAKKELGRIPIFGRAWQAAGHISVDRGDRESARRSLEEAGKLIRSDRSGVILFVEGTRSRTGELQPFKKGAFMLALHTGVDIVPVAVCGSRRVLPKGGWIVRPGTITVRIGESIRTADYGFEKRDGLMKRARAEIERLMESQTAPGATV